MRFLISISILILLFSSGSLSAQEVKSNPVRFQLKTTSSEIFRDTIPPKIKILEPHLLEDSPFHTLEGEMDIVGEVSDQAKIRFVSVNREILMVNETGVFVSRLRLNAGENRINIKTMDEHNNMEDVVYIVDYEPPIVTLADRIHMESTYYGLLIGIDEYNDLGLEDLDNPIRDAESLQNVLTSNYNFSPENVHVLRNPKRADIIEELDQLRERVTSSDNLLIFYAGHGFYDEVAEVGYWLPSDASRESSADWFPNSTLVNHLKAIPSKHTLLITDACFAGSIFKSRSAQMTEERVYERIYEKPSRNAMTSGTLTEVPDESAFIKYLIQRLNENKETYLSSAELYHSMKRAVISNSNILPRYGEIQNVGNEGGEFIFLRDNKR